jgi:membrane protein involved in colicin uptake
MPSGFAAYEPSRWKSPATKRYEEKKRADAAKRDARYVATRPKSDQEKEAERRAREEKRLRDFFGDLIR